MMDKAAFADRIAKLRVAKGLSQHQLSQMLGVKRSVVSYYESGDRLPSYDVLMEMSRVFNVSTDYLLKGKDAEIERFVSSVLSLYKNTIKERLPRILEAVDIRKIVEDRINEMDMSEAEKIILDVISKELRAIVWLGAGLGFIMGFVNCLII